MLQYERFWHNPTEVPILWSAQLFGILCIGATLDNFSSPPLARGDEAASAKVRFLTSAAQCLHLGDYTRPRPYVIEALLLYAQCKYMATLEPVKEV